MELIIDIFGNYLFCPGANGFADLVPKTFFACPGGIGLPLGCFGGFGGLGGVPQDVKPIAKMINDK